MLSECVVALMKAVVWQARFQGSIRHELTQSVLSERQQQASLSGLERDVCSKWITSGERHGLSIQIKHALALSLCAKTCRDAGFKAYGFGHMASFLRVSV